MRRLLLLTGLLVLATASAAAAHGVIAPAEVTAGEETAFTITIEHGCGGEGGATSPTVEVAVRVPPELVVTAIAPRDDGFAGAAVDERGAQVVEWTGGTLPGGSTGAFTFSAVPRGAVGTVVVLPVFQGCEQGEVLWADDDPAADRPAPTVEVVAVAAAPVTPVPLVAAVDPPATAPATVPATSAPPSPDPAPAPAPSAEAPSPAEPAPTAEPAQTAEPTATAEALVTSAGGPAWLLPAVVVAAVAAPLAILLGRRRR